MAKRGPKTEEGKARALANLKPPWQPGEAPVPPGRTTAGASVKERFNAMQGKSVEELTVIANDPASCIADVAAANQWLRAKDRGDELDRILDRTDGKPSQSKTVTHQGPGGGPVEVESRHTFDHDRFADLYRNRNGARSPGRLAPCGNGHH